jgi:DNA-binding transcriptional ArsR family regulator
MLRFGDAFLVSENRIRTMTDEIEEPEPEIPPEYRADIDMDAYDSEELDPPDWITDLDREILALLGNTGVIMTPAVIAKNIERARSSISRRLNTLEAGGMVEKVERGHYKISDEGHARMIQDVPMAPPKGVDSDENWLSIKILTPEEIKELKEKGRLD